MVHYEGNGLKGEDNSSDEFAITIGYEWRMGSWECETGASLGWTNYSEDHPVYNKKRQATNYDGSTRIGDYEPLGWSQVSI